MDLPPHIQTLIVSLLSGLMGSLIGAVIAYKGTMDAAGQHINSLYKQEKERREYERKQKEKDMVNFLLTEVKENFDLATTWQTNHSKSILSTEAWGIYKGEITTLPPQLQELLIKSYSEIKRYNSLVEYDREKVSFGSGAMDQAIQKQAAAVAEIAKSLIEALTNHTKIIPPLESKKSKP